MLMGDAFAMKQTIVHGKVSIFDPPDSHELSDERNIFI
ncbi:hypothetical protein URH17368_1750 [Alicyclobacillus hesperidum URH17-3-68]|nr:hypothetical protein URH17368_1750 [Alicyclobacillus hesperidum URH17-3-68]